MSICLIPSPAAPARRPLRLGTVVAAVLVVTGCASGPTATSTEPAADAVPAVTTTYPVTVPDCGKEVRIDTRPAKVLTVGTAAVSLLDAAGVSSAITARTGEFGAELPADLKTPPTGAQIVDPSDPSAEAIIGAGVDTVYGYGLFNAKPAQLESAGLTLLTVAPECGHDATKDAAKAVDTTDITAEVRRLGSVFDTTAIAEPAAAALDQRVAALTRPAAADAPTAAWLYYFSSSDSLSAYGKGGIAQGLLTRTGLTNAYASEPGSYLQISAESLLDNAPEWLVLTYGLYGETAEQAKAKLLAEPGVSDLPAITKDQLILVPSSASEPSPQSVDGLETLTKAVPRG